MLKLIIIIIIFFLPSIGPLSFWELFNILSNFWETMLFPTLYTFAVFIIKRRTFSAWHIIVRVCLEIICPLFWSEDQVRFYPSFIRTAVPPVSLRPRVCVAVTCCILYVRCDFTGSWLVWIGNTYQIASYRTSAKPPVGPQSYVFVPCTHGVSQILRTHFFCCQLKPTNRFCLLHNSCKLVKGYHVRPWSQTPHIFLKLLRNRAAKHTRRKVLSTLLRIHELTDTHDWLVLLWLTWQRVYATAPTQRAWSV